MHLALHHKDGWFSRIPEITYCYIVLRSAQFILVNWLIDPNMININ